MNKLSTIYYISQGSTIENHLLNIERVCKCGCKLIQLRLKNERMEAIKNAAKSALDICNRFNATLIINDYIEVAEALPNVGLHIGKNDISVNEARKTLPNRLIGGTANTLNDCIKLTNDGVDYIGLGPFRYTTTKSNIEPILELSGFKELKKKIVSLRISTPLYAIGGIRKSDIPDLMSLGLKGVAVSSLLTIKDENNIKSIISLYE